MAWEPGVLKEPARPGFCGVRPPAAGDKPSGVRPPVLPARLSHPAAMLDQSAPADREGGRLDGVRLGGTLDGGADLRVRNKE